MMKSAVHVEYMYNPVVFLTGATLWTPVET